MAPNGPPPANASAIFGAVDFRFVMRFSVGGLGGSGCCVAAFERARKKAPKRLDSASPRQAHLREPARLAGVLAARAAAPRAGALALSLATLRLSSSMRLISTSISLADGTPSLLRALATRSSKMLSSLSHCPDAFEEMSVAMVAMRLVASEMRSSAACLLYTSPSPRDGL